MVIDERMLIGVTIDFEAPEVAAIAIEPASAADALWFWLD